MVVSPRRNMPFTRKESPSGSIQVVVRLRPMTETEKKFGTLPVVSASTNDGTVTVIKDKSARKARLTYSFDNVYTAFSTQEEVFDQTMLPVFDDVLQGYESTVFAYGQTGTGKTYTVEGDLSNPDLHGVIPRSAFTIFDRLKSSLYTSYKVTCSYLEIYNEELSDLLVDEGCSSNRGRYTKLEIMVGKAGPFCRGLSEKEVSSPEDVLSLMAMAQKHRQVGETNMNKSSSRSHCIFTIKVKAQKTCVDGNGILDINGKLHMVDLAGSECAKTASGDAYKEATRERERMNINRSLLTLGRVISMLKEQSQQGHKKSIRIPYRDSKLTRILQESLGGRCKTVVIATLSPSATVIEESISTLNYAQSASRIVNKPVTNSYLSFKNLSGNPMKNGMVGEEEMHGFKSVDDWNEMEIRLQYMGAQVEEAQSALGRKHLLLQEADEKAEKATAEKEEMESIVNQQNQEMENLKDNLAAETQKSRETAQLLKETKNKLAEQTLRAEKAEDLCEKLEEELKNAKLKIQSLEENLEKEIGQKKDALGRLRDVSIDLKKTRAVLSATQRTESLLTNEAQDLIGTLKKSITDGDSLYDSLEKHREEDIQMRVNTRKHSDTQKKILDDILQYLLLLARSATRLCEQLNKESADNHSQANNTIDQTTNLFQQISTDISEISTIMRNQIVGAGGLVPVVASTTTDSMVGLDHATKIITESEDGLFTAISFLRTRLQHHSSQLGRLWTELDGNTEAAISALSSNVECSKKKLIQMIMSTNQTLTAVKNVQKETRESQTELITAWETSSLNFTQDINNTAEARYNAVNKSLEIFKAEIRNIDKIDDTLTKQDKFITKSGDEIKNELNKQQISLKKLEKIQTSDCETLEELRGSFVSNVMKGVQSLIDEQMDTMKVESIRHFNVCDKKNKELIEQNMILNNSTRNTFDDIKKDNSTLTDKAKSARKNDVAATEAIESARKTLGDISDTATKHEVTASMFARKVEENISKLSKLDVAAEEIVKGLNDNKVELTEELDNTILKKGKENLNLLAGSGRNLASYGDTVLIPECYASLDGMEAPRSDVLKKFNAMNTQNKEILERGKLEVESISEKQCIKTDEIRKYVRCKEDYFANKICKIQKIQLDDQKQKLLLQTKQYGKIASKDISNCESNTTVVKTNMEAFVVGTIKARDDISPLIERTNFIFEENFSSTPEYHTICEALNFEKEMAIGVHS